MQKQTPRPGRISEVPQEFTAGCGGALTPSSSYHLLQRLSCRFQSRKHEQHIFHKQNSNKLYYLLRTRRRWNKQVKADGKQQHNQLVSLFPSVCWWQSSEFTLFTSWAGKLHSGPGTCWQKLIWVCFWIWVFCCFTAAESFFRRPFSDFGFTVTPSSLVFRGEISVKLRWIGSEISLWCQQSWNNAVVDLVWWCELLQMVKEF